MTTVKFKVYSRTETSNGWEVRLNHVAPQNGASTSNFMPANGGSIVLSNLTSEEKDNYPVDQVFELTPLN